MSKQEKVRVLSLALIRNGNRILVSEGYDREKGERFFRLLGGGVEFGERLAEALVREIREELGQEIRVASGPPSVVENLFVFEGRPGHEVCFIHEAEFVDRTLYEREKLPLAEESFRGRSAVWVDPSEKGILVYPPFDLCGR